MIAGSRRLSRETSARTGISSVSKDAVTQPPPPPDHGHWSGISRFVRQTKRQFRHPSTSHATLAARRCLQPLIRVRCASFVALVCSAQMSCSRRALPTSRAINLRRAYAFTAAISSAASGDLFYVISIDSARWAGSVVSNWTLQTTCWPAIARKRSVGVEGVP